MLAALALATAFLLTGYYYPLETLLVFALVLVLVIFFVKPEWGLYLTAFSVPIINWNFSLGSLSISFVESLALLLLISFSARLLVDLAIRRQHWKDIVWPLKWPFLIFLAVALISSLFSKFVLFSSWYSVRWLLFLYLAYIWLPINIIKDKKNVWRNTLVSLVLSGLAVAVMGLVSLFYQDWYESFFRIQPLSVFGVWPIGYNHNLIAEYLVIITFFVLYLRNDSTSARKRRGWEILFAVLLLVTIGTFSRTAWIVLAFESLLLVAANIFVNRRLDLKKCFFYISLIVILLLPFVWRMDILQEKNVSSTENRLLLSQIAWKTFSSHPIVGYGTGMFVYIVDNNIRFRANYGDALDSHGVLQKIMAENGTLGLLAFSIIIITLVIKLIKPLKKRNATALAYAPLAIGVLGGIVYQFFNTSYYKGKLWIPIALVLVMSNYLMKGDSFKTNQKFVKSGAK